MLIGMAPSLGFGQAKLVPDPPQLGHVPSRGWVCAKYTCVRVRVPSALGQIVAEFGEMPRRA
ncbi:hypothetical protein VP01_3656g2 [Puccinia sorghi]|uniref:Uncharacterized protein n=1 Tax=Puccinia sorghi TaxID=27349 RepID=A0A0L6UV96_9BASI|nr:hypothetical protein VP01_3656g2 [Puccinia sorghi]